MTITHLTITFDFPYVQSLKGRRTVLNSLKERLKKFNVSVLDASGEYVKEGALEVVFLSPGKVRAKQYVQKIEEMFERHSSEIEFTVIYDFL